MCSSDLNPSPFIVSVNHGDSGGRREYPINAPLNTMTQSNGLGVVVPSVAPFATYAQHGGQNRGIEDPLHTITASTKDQNARSEERRVGKECRSRWSPDH